MKYMQTYKCRLCDEVFYDAGTENRSVAMADTFATICGRKMSAQSSVMNTVHFCKNGGVGVADFIGYSEELEIENKDGGGENGGKNTD